MKTPEVRLLSVLPLMLLLELKSLARLPLGGHLTLAICIKCGAQKLGAFTLCAECGCRPRTPEDQAKSLALSDHNMPQGGLEEVAERIRAGEEISFDEASISELASDIREHPEVMKMPLGCKIAVWTPVVIMILLALFIAALFIYDCLIIQ